MTDYTMEDLLPEEQEHLDSLDEMSVAMGESIAEAGMKLEDIEIPDWMKESEPEPLEDEAPTADYDDIPPEDEPEDDEEEVAQEEESPEENDEDEENPVSGDRLSLRGNEFAGIIDRADEALNRLVSKLHVKGQKDGEMTLKISIVSSAEGYYFFSGDVRGKINDTIAPLKIAGQEIELQFDAYGNPILPAEREQQLTFETAETVSATVTTDASGVVESVELDGEDTDPVDESVDNENESTDIEKEEPAEVTVEVTEETMEDEAV